MKRVPLSPQLPLMSVPSQAPSNVFNTSHSDAPPSALQSSTGSGLATGTGVSVRTTLGSRRGSIMTAPGVLLSRLLRNSFKRGRVNTILRFATIAAFSIVSLALVLCARPRLTVTDEALTFRLERADSPLLKKWLSRTNPHAHPNTGTHTTDENEEESSGNENAAGHPRRLIAAPFTTSRALSNNRPELPIPSECAEWRALAKDPRRLVLYSRHFTSLDYTDWFIFVSMFTEAWHAARHANQWRPVYVDVAANHAKRWSNTWFLDRCLGWDGICAEANPGYHEELRAERHCALIDTCVSDIPQVVNFSFTAAYGGVVKGEGNTWGVDGAQHALKPKFHRHHRGFRALTCTTLAKELSKLRVRKVDFLSLDVEGYELPVLQGIDWGKTTIDVMVVENKRREVPEFLKKKGYDRFAGLLKDDIYIRQGSGYEINSQFASWLKTVSRKDNRVHIEKLAATQT